jgi:drug/metabolite transporter (DMT)-like permease
MLTWVLILLTVFAGSGGDVLCAQGMSAHGPVTNPGRKGIAKLVFKVVTRRLILLGFVCDAIGFFALLALLSVAQLSIAVPATALSFVVDTLGAHFFLHETVHWKRWLGVLLVTAGVLLTVQSGSGKVSVGTRPATAAALQSYKH